MDFKEFMKDRKLLVCDDFLTDVEAIELLIKETKYDIIKYPCTKKIFYFCFYKSLINSSYGYHK